MYQLLKGSEADARLEKEIELKSRLEDLGWSGIDDLQLFEVDGVIVGCADVTDDGGSVEIHWINILPEHLKKGYGRAFLQSWIKSSLPVLIHGSSLPESVGFWFRMGARFPNGGLDKYLNDEFEDEYDLIPFELILDGGNAHACIHSL